MKKSIVKSLMFMGITLIVIGCGSGSSTQTTGSGGTGTETGLPEEVEIAIDASKTTLSQALKDSISYMYSEEGLAYDVYMNIYKIQAVQQLQKIAQNAEVKHIEAVNQIAIKYDLNVTQYPDTDVPYSVDDMNRYGSGEYPIEPIQELYNILYDKGIQSQKDALEVGCMVEVVDIDDLDKYILEAQASNASDVLTVFNFLRDGSYAHYWSFDEGLKNMGISDGCCSLGQEYCHREYPQKEKGGKNH